MSSIFGGSWVVVALCFFFFFFKQKTAYEMRISDWSSDVCSSDLHVEEAAHAGAVAAQRLDAQRDGVFRHRAEVAAGGLLVFQVEGDLAGHGDGRERQAEPLDRAAGRLEGLAEADLAAPDEFRGQHGEARKRGGEGQRVDGRVG